MRLADPSDALQAWALIAQYGSIPGWRPRVLSGGDCDSCDWHQAAYLRVERFWLRPGTARWRSMVLRLELEGREPTMREYPEAMMFARRFAGWWREHGIPPEPSWR